MNPIEPAVPVPSRRSIPPNERLSPKMSGMSWPLLARTAGEPRPPKTACTPSSMCACPQPMEPIPLSHRSCCNSHVASCTPKTPQCPIGVQTQIAVVANGHIPDQHACSPNRWVGYSAAAIPPPTEPFRRFASRPNALLHT